MILLIKKNIMKKKTTIFEGGKTFAQVLQEGLAFGICASVGLFILASILIAFLNLIY